MRGLEAVLALAVLACHAPAPAQSVPPSPGLSISIYDTSALVDDRRWLDVTGGELALEHVDPGAQLESLIVEPIGGALRVGACTRDELPRLDARPDAAPRFASAVHCRVAGAPGRYLVRVAYVTSGLAYRAQHDIDAVDPERIAIRSRFAIATPAWGERADVTVLAGQPGAAEPPRELARGTVVLDGSIAVLAAPPHETRGQLRRVYDRATYLAESDPEPSAVGHPAVWVWLELADARLAGSLHVHAELPGEGARDVDVPAERATREDVTRALRVPLWIDPALHGLRQRELDYVAGATLAERFSVTVANSGDAAREVWIEEPLRPLRRPRLERTYGKPAVAGRFVRAKLVVAPTELGRVAFTVAYDD